MDYKNSEKRDQNVQEKVQRKAEKLTSEEIKERERKWEIASIPQMRGIVPGLILENVRASLNRELLQENHINASLTHWRSLGMVL
jgi:hypothetical protein